MYYFLSYQLPLTSENFVVAGASRIYLSFPAVVAGGSCVAFLDIDGMTISPLQLQLG